MIDVTFRTVIRAFLLIGGSVFVVQGAIQGSAFDLGLGLAAALLGGVGLWWEWYQHSSKREDSMDNL